ncbi:ABC transporter substrate-binding protein [Nocardia stercoris]|uniref:ABC transporter substrate-binding protein n=1 Tax=Nocardia stercoris TaxID=2483361 RepID=A0A3M2L0V1_9NOCA|nr:ABC transporter substrate-binding protein [Nocardia stercoris]RMI31322.1 ABC transporter substrate-binding protein [Nocardia stercoris]
MKRALALAAVAALTTALAACGGNTGETTGGTPHPGGTLRYGLSQAPTCPDPAQAGTNQTIYVDRQVVDSLTDQDPASGQPKPWLADSWQIGTDARSFTFHLRDGVTFGDGTPLTADSVGRTFDSIVRLGGAKAPLGASYLAGYTGSTVIDPHTVRVDFDRPNSQFLQATSTPQLGILADATTSKSAEDRCAAGAVVGSGPFTFADWKQGASATLAKRAGYAWGSAVFATTGEPYLDRIQFTVIPESGVRVGSVSSGQLDAASDVLPQDAAQVESAGGRVLNFTNPGIPFGLQPNVTRGPLRDPQVRKALQTAIDRKELVDTVLGPQFKTATSALASRTPGYVDHAADLTFDRARTTQTLDAAGWAPGPDGIRVKDGQRLSFSVLYASVFAGNQAILELVQQQLKKSGIELRLDQQAAAEYTARQNRKDYDALYYNTTRADGDILRTTFGLDQQNFNARGPIPDLDQVLGAELATTDAAQRAGLIARAQQSVLDNGLWIPTIELSQAIGTAGSVADLKFEASGRLQFHDAWLRQ